MKPIALPADLDKKVQELIEKSGNGFHFRVVNLLREMEWKVLVSPYYNDNITDKPREIDIIAEKEYEVRSRMGVSLGTVAVRLFVECKYIADNMVFWFDQKDKERATERVVADSGLDVRYQSNEINQHHYTDEVTVAKLFISEKSREEYDPINKAINQSINSMIYYRYRHDLFPEPKDRMSSPLGYVSYPMIITNSFAQLFGTGMTVSDDVKFLRISDPFQLEVNYAYLDKDRRGRNEYFLIDVLDVNSLSGFVSKLENRDIELIKERYSYTSDPSRNWEQG